MIKLKVEVTPQSEQAMQVRIARAKTGIANGAEAGIKEATIAVQRHIVADLLQGQLVRHVTGNLGRSVFTKFPSPLTGIVFVGKEAPYGRFVNDGTSPHVITATNRQALRFQIGGTTLFRKSVNHPGITPRKFMERGLADMRDEIRARITRRIAAAMRGE